MKNAGEYDDVNETELVELCRQRGLLNVHRGLGRKTLIDVLTGKVDDDELSPDPYDEFRDLMTFIMIKYPHHKQQLRCANERYFCPTCPTGRVAKCAVLDVEESAKQEMMKELAKARYKGIM